MNVICLICSELLKNEEIVSTSCGHVFHRSCVESWIQSSRTCPTCRHEETTRDLIKLYFEFDDNRANLNIDEVLKTNEELTKDMKSLRANSESAEEKCRMMEKTMKDLTEKSKFLERQKQLDDMAIAGLKTIKDESTKMIIKLNGWMKSLKLDLLAEKQLRRLLQENLHDLDQQNENYDITKIIVDESKIRESLNARNDATLMDVVEPAFMKPILPFWKLNCEAKTIEKPLAVKTPYIIPSKIQRATNSTKEQKASDKMLAYRRRSPSNRPDVKPQGFQFTVPVSSTAASQSSTSTADLTSNKIQKRTFGEGKPLFEGGPSSSTTSPSTLTNNAFNFTVDAPTFQTSPSSFATACSNIKFSNILMNYRQFDNQSPSSSSPRSPGGSSLNTNFSNVTGPKISDR